jgi:hypothetical protein
MTGDVSDIEIYTGNNLSLLLISVDIWSLIIKIIMKFPNITRCLHEAAHVQYFAITKPLP